MCVWIAAVQVTWTWTWPLITMKLAPNKKTRNHLLRIPYDLRLKSVCLNWTWSVLHIHIQSLKPLCVVCCCRSRRRRRCYCCCCSCRLHSTRLDSTCCRLYRIRIKESSLPKNASSHLLYFDTTILPSFAHLFVHSFVRSFFRLFILSLNKPTNSSTHTYKRLFPSPNTTFNMKNSLFVETISIFLFRFFSCRRCCCCCCCYIRIYLYEKLFPFLLLWLLLFWRNQFWKIRIHASKSPNQTQTHMYNNVPKNQIRNRKHPK